MILESITPKWQIPATKTIEERRETPNGGGEKKKRHALADKQKNEDKDKKGKIV